MICEYFPDQIRAQAKASAARYAEGKTLGPLDGVPIAMKDQLDIEGHRRRNGLEFCESGAAIEDCTITARCRAQGGWARRDRREGQGRHRDGNC